MLTRLCKGLTQYADQALQRVDSKWLTRLCKEWTLYAYASSLLDPLNCIPFAQYDLINAIGSLCH